MCGWVLDGQLWRCSPGLRLVPERRDRTKPNLQSGVHLSPRGITGIMVGCTIFFFFLLAHSLQPI